MVLSLLISRLKQLRNNINIYLEPLIKDLKLLRTKGVDVYDRFTLENFKSEAILLWTIKDFLTYGNLSGHVVKGFYACSIYSGGYHGSRLKTSKEDIIHNA